MKGDDCVDDDSDSTLDCPQNKQRSCSSNQKPINQEILSDGTYCYSCVAMSCEETNPNVDSSKIVKNKSECDSNTHDLYTIKNDGKGFACYECRTKETCANKYNDDNYMTEAECEAIYSSYSWTLGDNEDENNPSACGECKSAQEPVTCAVKYNDNNYMTKAECDAKGASYTWTPNEDESDPSACGECIAYDHDQDSDQEPETCADKYNDINYMTKAECDGKGDLYSWKQSGNLAKGTQCGKCEEVTCEELGKSREVTYCPFNYDLQEGTTEYKQADAKLNDCKASFEAKLSTGYAEIIDQVDHASDGDCAQIIQKCEGYVDGGYYDSHCYKATDKCPDKENYVKIIEYPDSGYGIYDGVCRKATCKDMGYDDTACAEGYLDIETVMDNKICHKCIQYAADSSHCYITDIEQAAHPSYKTYVLGSITRQTYLTVYENNPQKYKEDFTDKGAYLAMRHSNTNRCIYTDINIEDLCAQCKAVPYKYGNNSLFLGECVANTWDGVTYVGRGIIQNPVEKYFGLPGTFDCGLYCSVVATGSGPDLSTIPTNGTLTSSTKYWCKSNGNYSGYTY